MPQPEVDADDLSGPRYRVLGVNPFGRPDARLVAAVCRGGGLGVLELGGGAGGDDTAAALSRVNRDVPTPFGVRVGQGCALRPEDVLGPSEPGPTLVVLGAGAPWAPVEVHAADPTVVLLAEVTGLDEARSAVAAGARGLIARGHEAAGRVGDLTSFVLLQQLLGADDLAVPVWACGGIGHHTAAGAVAGGAAGIVLDSQLALFPDSDTPFPLREALARMDGSETEIVGGDRVLPSRAGAPPVPLGQDAHLAALLCRRHESAEATVRDLVHALGDHEPVAGPDEQGAALRRTLGTRHAVAQGPMTRVSDQPGFAAAVAEHGGMPFVAVALSDGRRTADLLRRTAQELGERPWGAGILGFVPERLRAEQLEAVRAARPRAVIIAGGTPAQAAALESEDIATYLHVPSPILLRQYLRAGARRFVFEGAECGGHIGPRTSFSLWEAQLSVLDDELARTTGGSGPAVEVFFAGGVHDARSAAMVAAMAAPLANRGVSFGVLMGTAYLFTDEAVRHGAITGQFRRQALAAQVTATLETAPGHLTRCLHSPFVTEFHAIREELRAGGLPAQQRWQRLEELNTGRLRIASKGLRRNGDELYPVDETEQLAEGMFMAGQVAVLRSAPTGVAELHGAVTEGAAALLGSRRTRRTPVQADPVAPEAGVLGDTAADVAIVGMACVLPGAADLAAFWSGVLRGTDAVTEVDPRRWDPAVYCDGGDGMRSASRWGGFIPPVGFDPMSFGIPPTSMGSIDPAQLLSLEVARRALHDAGYGQRPFDRERASVIFGAEAGGDLANAGVLRALLPAYLGEVPAELDARLPRLTEDSFPGTLANVISGRIANRLDLGGANYTVDAACGSSLAALDLAVKELAQRTSDLVLCGAVDLHNGINDYLMFTSAGALSPTGRCRPFDRSADGIALGEGVACLALKRLADAERDGDRVYAVVRGVGAASDGRSLGLTAPRPEGQRRALERAYRQAGVSPAEVGLIEAHGTGTVVGDGTELRTLTAFFQAAGAEAGTCALGSVKSQIGHTKCAAGLAGLIKTALSLWFGVLPPTLQLREPHAEWDADTSPFTFDTTARPWPASGLQRAAGVSAFGFGGTNFHAVLTAPRTTSFDRHTLRDWDAELVLVRAADQQGESRVLRELLDLAESGDFGLTQLAVEAARRADSSVHPIRAAVVAGSVAELADILRAAVTGADAKGLVRADPTAEPGSMAFLFPGQGSQRPGMFAELFVAFPDLRTGMDADRVLTEVVFPPAAFDPAHQSAQRERLRDTRFAQPALGMVELAVVEFLDRLGVRPDLLGGHSYGELVALCAAGAFDREALLRLSRARAAAIAAAASADPGAMAAVRGREDEVGSLLRQGGLAESLVVANHNAPDQIVLSGPTAAIETAVGLLRSRSIGAKRINVACAFHSPLVAGAAPTFAEALAAERITQPRAPVWANRTARRYPEPSGSAAGSAVRTELTAQLAAPVRFTQQIEDMYRSGARIFVEVGPGSVLSGLTSSILAGRAHTVVACDPGQGKGMRGILTAVARMAVAGAEVRADWLTRGRAEPRPPASKPPLWTVDGHLVRRPDGEFPANGLVPATLIPRSHMSQPQPTGQPSQSTSAATERDRVVVDFLRNSRESIAAQRDVLLGYLGATPAPPAVHTVPQPQPQQQPADVAIPATAPVAEPEVAPDVLTTVIEVISDRTGYPADMIDHELDLEADLSIDSIKRTEIAGTLIGKLGLTETAGEDGQDALSRKRTARAITEWIEQRGSSSTDSASSTDSVPSGSDGTGPEQPAAEVAGAAPQRFVLDAVSAPLPADSDSLALRGAHVAVVHEKGQRELVDAVSSELANRGAVVQEVPAGDDQLRAGEPGIVVLLGPLVAGDDQVVEQVFTTVRAVLADAHTVLVAAPAQRGSADAVERVAGLRGLLRAVARERADSGGGTRTARLVEVDPDAPAADLARLLLSELGATGGAVVRRIGDERAEFALRARELEPVAFAGAGPAGPDAADAAAIGLSRDSVVVLLGGARGIAARFAGRLAAAAGCRFELAGRTAWPPEREDPDIADIGDAAGLRAALSARGGSISEVEAAVRTVLAQREIGRTLAEIRTVGGQAEYREIDVRDGAAVRQLLKDVHATHGRLDGVVYAAGVIDDRLVQDKELVSFRTVFGTKVDGARAVLDSVTELGLSPRFITFFGSIAAVLGNRGQADYAAANDALHTMGTAWARRTGRRVLTVHWGPWAPSGDHAGMVSAELAREYQRRDVGLIDPDEGTACLLRELAHGAPDTTAVVYTASMW
ncbi:Acyl transferase domain-containing protein [Amycolatopsis marina]|uniref:Acyl transferase domain-containing protein n=1 Tax=Amycolatopsis marina TaxID=490629 RepID=A0A1I1CA85_9PSEU|nr:type I polyketide synthase [Amycolatopsis marina]SFB58906.1 Acyl transferase domain-containing protein [Amycolatopsis marina]